SNYMLNTWRNSPWSGNGTTNQYCDDCTWDDNNNLHTDFELYSTMEDLEAETNKWSSCNYNDPGIGFPRDCGPNGVVGGQWNSLYRGGQQHVQYDIYTPGGSGVATSGGTLAQWTAEYTPDSNFNGSDEIKYKVLNPNNENGESDESVIAITINPVNDLPVLNPISNIVMDEDTMNIVDVYFDDPDSELALSATSSNPNMTVRFTESSNSLEIQPDNNFYGSAAITVTATEVNFNFEQSTVQAFYFITVAEIDGISIQDGDHIIAYKQNSFGLPFGNPVGGA
ncbi:uncharacterized protein METZ01_LOCUS404605, partial [marine metagenome]